MSEGLPVEVTCRVVGVSVSVSVSGFYERRRRKPSARAVRYAMVADVILQVHEASRQTYGARRVHAELVLGHNMTVARCTVELVMRRLGLAGLPGRPKHRKVPNTPTASDLVNRHQGTHRGTPRHLPGLVGYAYDRALRGVHLDRLLKAGHVGLVGVRRKGTKPDDRYHGLETLHPTTGTSRPVEIHLVGGAPHLRTFDVDGNPHLTRLQRRRINKRTNRRDGTVRLSAEYDVPGPDGTPTGYIRIRLDHTTQDQLRGHNRPEHLRAFPETDPVFTNVQRVLRGSAESANRIIDDHLPRERLHHFGFTRNHLSMLAWQTYRNAQTEAVFAPGALDQPAPLQASG